MKYLLRGFFLTTAVVIGYFLIAISVWTFVAHAAPTSRLERTLIPELNSAYYLGTTSPSVIAWKGIIADQICLTADTCRTTWPTGASFPFTVTGYGVSTTTIVGFLNGLLSNASTTLSGVFRLPSLATNGVLTIFNGLVGSTASSSLNLPNGALQNSSITINSTAISLGGSGTVTAASSTLLGDNNRFTGTNSFANTITGSITGNAGTATKLQTARNINSVLFDGSSDITITAASSTLLGDNNRFTGTNSFANTITGSISGNAGTASTLATGRTIAITGDISYTSPIFDGSTNVTAAGTLATVNGNVGTFTNPTITANAKGLITAISNGSSGSGTVGTSSLETSGRVPFWTTTSGYPAQLSGGSANFAWDNSNNILSSLHYLATGSSTFQNFTAINSTTTNATTTGTIVSNIASTSIQYFGFGSCLGGNALQVGTDGKVTCGSISGSGAPAGTGSELQYRFDASTFGAVGTSAYNAGQNFLGLGTTTPRALLNLASSTDFQLMISDGSNSSVPFFIRAIGNTFTIGTTSATVAGPAASSTKPFMVFNSTTGQMAIGTTTFLGDINIDMPRLSFQLNGGINFVTRDANTSDAGGIVFDGYKQVTGQNTSAANVSILWTTRKLVGGNAYQINTRTGGGGSLAAMVFENNNGLIGIGTSSPAVGLDVSNSLTALSQARPQFFITDGFSTSATHRFFRNVGGYLYEGTAAASNYATTTLITTDPNGRFGVGSSSPFAFLSVDATTLNSITQPLFTISTSTSNVFGQIFNVMGTTSEPVLTSANTANSGFWSGARVAIGSLFQYGFGGILDQLFVNGRINTGDTRFVECNNVLVGGQTQDTPCGTWGFRFDLSGSINQMLASSVGTSIQITSSNSTIVAANAGAGFFYPSMLSNAFNAQNNVPVMEAVTRISPVNATSTKYDIGFTGVNPQGSTFEANQVTGCWFTASSTATVGDWYAAVGNGTSATYTDTGVASSSSITSVGNFYRMRIEMGADPAGGSSSQCKFYIQSKTGNLVKVLDTVTGPPSSSSFIATANMSNTAAGLIKTMEINDLKFWYRQPTEN